MECVWEGGEGRGGAGRGVKTHEEGRKGTLAIELLFFFKFIVVVAWET